MSNVESLEIIVKFNTGVIKRISHLFNSSVGQKSDTDFTKLKPSCQEALGEIRLCCWQKSVSCDCRITGLISLPAVS